MKSCRHIMFLALFASMMILGVILTSGSCQAVSIGANPSSITAEVEKSGLYNCSLYVFNLDKANAMNCKLNVSEEYSSWVTFNKTTFTVAPDSYEVVEFELRPPANSASNCSFYIYILGTSDDSNGTPISAGLKVPVNAELTASQSNGLPLEVIVIIAVAAIILISVLYVLVKKGIIMKGKGEKK